MRDRLDKFIKDHGLKHWSFAARRDKSFLDDVNDATADMPADTAFPVRVYSAVSGERPTCALGGERTLKNIVKGWRFCGPAGICECARQSVSASSKAMDHEARLAKTRATLMARYGTENPGQTPSAIEAHKRFYSNAALVQRAVAKGKTTMLENHGVDNALKLPIDRRAIAQRHLAQSTTEILNDREAFLAFAVGKAVPTIASQLGINETTVNNYLREYEAQRPGTSFDSEISAFLTEHDLAHQMRDRRIIAPLELDFVLPDFKVAIEFNGLYFHTSRTLKSNYHAVKYKRCSEAGYRLLMINEDEYVARPEVFRKKVMNLCGRSERGPGARKLAVGPLDVSEAMAFCERHHLQGSPRAVVKAYGAYEGHRLCAVVTMGRQRGTQAADLTRFCADGRIYAGLFSKMLTRVRQDFPGPIITFADLRYSDGNLYRASGFEEVATIRPDYRYVWRRRTFHKALFTRDRIAKKFDFDMTGHTEKSAMEALGYYRIYDCGKIKFQIG